MRRLTLIVALFLLLAALGVTAAGVTAALARTPGRAAELPAPAAQLLAAPAVSVQEVVQQGPVVASAVQEDNTPADIAPTWVPGMMRGQGRHGAAGMGRGMMGAIWGDQRPHVIIAATLGITVDELAEAVQGGATIDSLAAERGVAVQDIVAALSAAHEAALQDAVAAGTITAEQAELVQARMSEMWTLRLQEGRPFGGRGFGNGDGTGPDPNCPMQDGSGNPTGRRGGMQGRGFGYGQRGGQGQGNPAAGGPNG